MKTKPTRGRPTKDNPLVGTSVHLRQNQIEALEAMAGPEDTRNSMIRRAVDFFIQKRVCSHTCK